MAGIVAYRGSCVTALKRSLLLAVLLLQSCQVYIPEISHPDGDYDLLCRTHYRCVDNDGLMGRL